MLTSAVKKTMGAMRAIAMLLNSTGNHWTEGLRTMVLSRCSDATVDSSKTGNIIVVVGWSFRGLGWVCAILRSPGLARSLVSKATWTSCECESRWVKGRGMNGERSSIETISLWTTYVLEWGYG